MLSSLHKYVNTILKSLHIQCDAFVYDIASEIPEWCQSICITHQFLIVLPDSSDYAERVERFIGQRVFVFDTNLYWFAGEKLLTPIKAKKSESAAPKFSDCMKHFNEIEVNELKGFMSREQITLTPEESIAHPSFGCTRK